MRSAQCEVIALPRRCRSRWIRNPIRRRFRVQHLWHVLRGVLPGGSTLAYPQLRTTALPCAHPSVARNPVRLESPRIASRWTRWVRRFSVSVRRR